MMRFASRSVLASVALLSFAMLAGLAAPAGAQLIYTAPNSTGTLLSLTSGFWNTAMGTDALTSLTEGVSNTGLGVWALTSLQTGARNVAVGQNALDSSVSSSDCVAVGYHSLSTLNTGGDAHDVAVGYHALHTLYEGAGITAVGSYAGEPMNDGANSTYLGYLSGPSSNGLVNATAIGYNAHVDASNSLVLGSTGDDAVKVGINTTTPTRALDVNGNTIRIRQDRTPSSSSETCLKGEMAWDGSYLYVCVSTNTWMRSALSSF
jgi:hypothetical protein